MIIVERILNGFISGLFLSAIIGPVTILCIQRTLANGFKTGFLVGVISAFINGALGIVAGIEDVNITNFIVSYEGIISAIGMMFSIWVAIGIIRSFPLRLTYVLHQNETPLYARAYDFFIALTNPITILLFIAYRTDLGLKNISLGNGSAISLGIGLFLGSIVWALFLNGIVEKTRKYLSKRILVRINTISGIMLLILTLHTIFKMHNL